MQEVFEKINERLETEIKLAYEDRKRYLNGSPVKFAKAVGYGNALAVASEIVNQVAEEYMRSSDGWIPCSERLPEIAGYRVLATLENPFGQKKVDTIFTGYGLNPFWYCNNPEIDLKVWKVIAWQPLPEPYKEEEKNDRA